ncbi:pleckstrin homology domain-containing family G member 4B-like [Genypterus blacodes]|uniref:pleckstrin homology domain-containing family G member 4B-like n=1 Tax=Genypterus blacodes TaxID=154954 RepID=UPI003F760795
MDPECLTSDSIQNLLSALYPPFEATAPTILSQLFHIIDSRFQGDALRCLLDFLVPAKHILDSVQQAACAQYSDVVFLCEGWPLCLRDQVVFHLAPVAPLLLRPGDFYLQVAAFCGQSARIVVCSLLEEEGLRAVEETPIPESSYPCIFSSDWLEEINRGRHGTPLSQCLLTAEQGVVRLPWQWVAVPEFVKAPQCGGSSMASAAPLPSSLPVPPPLPAAAAENSSTSRSLPVSPPKESASTHCPRTAHSSAPASSSRPSAFSVETRICPAKHGIAVSLCLVDARSAASSRPVSVKETETEEKPRGWVSPHTWDSRFSTNTRAEGGDKRVCVNIKQSHSKAVCVSVGVPEGEYIDVLQANMLFNRAQAPTEEQPKAHGQMQPYAQAEGDVRGHTHWQSPRGQMQAEAQGLMQPAHGPSRSDAAAALRGTGSPLSPLHHSHQHHRAHQDSHGAPQCVRAAQFSEKPCTPCMRRRQGAQVSRAQELRCRYRESYQAAISNPVAFGQEAQRRDLLAVMEEDGDFSQCGDDTLRSPDDLWCHVQGMWFDPGMQNHQASVTERICKESGERKAVPHWKAGDTNTAPCRDYRGTDALEQTARRTTVPFREPRDSNYQPHRDLQHVNGEHVGADLSAITHRRPSLSSGEYSAMNVDTMKPQNRTGPNICKSPAATQSRRGSAQSDGRCSSLSTAVVDTSQKCEVVLVDGQRVRRRESTGSRAEVPRLHVVKCKNTTAFGLVSPKLFRRRMDVTGSTSTIKRNVPQSQMDPPPAAETLKNLQSAPAPPRPDHLPLGPPDPRSHPLHLGVASLTGGRDRTGRAVVELCGHHQGWRSAVRSQELFQMLLYFHSITRREIRDAGLTFIFDARRMNPQPQLYKALMTLQEHAPQAVNSLVLLVDKDGSHRPDRCPGVQTDVVTSMKALLKLVEVSQLSSHMDGSLPPSRCDWLELHQKLFPFVCDLHEAASLLLRAISQLEEPQRADTVQCVQQCMMDQRTLMKDVLEDSRLVSLQREGGAMLARLRKESDLKYPQCEDLSDAVDSVTGLYNQVEEQAHVLVQRTNMSLEHLEYLLRLREMEGHFLQMQEWFDAEGERHLLEAESVEESGDRMEQTLNSFTRFLIEANDRRHHALSLVSEAERLQQSGSSYPETEAFGTLMCTFRSGLEDFLCRAEASGRELQVMINVCDFCEQATALASDCQEYLDQSESSSRPTQEQSLDPNITPVSKAETQPAQHQNQDLGPSPDPCYQPDVLTSGHASTGASAPGDEGSILHSFQERFLQFNPEKFQEVKAKASFLRGSRGMRVWNVAWLKCQEARQQLQERLHDVAEGQHQQQQPRSSSWCEHYVDVMSANVPTASLGGLNVLVQSTPGPRHPEWEGIVSGALDLGKRRPILGSSSTNSSDGACCKVSMKPEEHRDAEANQGSKVTPHSPHSLPETSSTPEMRVRSPSSCSHHGQPSCRILQEAQRFQISRHGSFCSDDSCLSPQGAAGGCKHSSLPAGRCEGTFGLTGPQEGASGALRLQRVMEELLFTEREYVRSLGYILTHYLPLLDRPDIPQDLRGKRGIIFGNLEKLYDFHGHYFLPELEACQREPAMVARCFLRHSESFGLYALYSKNKPRSDALILHRRHDIFKRKQQELGDMMDLSSYLLRPIQRISKYFLLLQDMLALAGGERERERAEIQAAADLVRFQMRHGNDLLTMDAIQDCDVNLKEQGQLIRQDEFTVFFRKKKCVRRVFLFEDLVLFSKTKKTEIGNDVYVYKQSFKTSDIGMTQTSAVSGLCFEIWFRRRKSEDTYTLKAPSMEVKKAWTGDLERILWEQAAHSRELRLQERVFMGMGRKPFMDIQHSEGSICDRAVSCSLPGRSKQTKHTPSLTPLQGRWVLNNRLGMLRMFRGVEFPRPRSVGSGSTASTTLSQSSSSSGRGSLPPAGYPGNPAQGADFGPGLCSSPEAVVDNELNSRHLHQHLLHRNCEQWKAVHHPLSEFRFMFVFV